MPHWGSLLASLAALGPSELQRRFATADRYLREAGVFYRVYGEAGGSERPLELAHMPLVLPSDEWQRITEGLVERAEVLEEVLRDLYGEQRLIADGALPAAVVSGSSEYLRPMIGAMSPEASRLWLYAADLGRGPDGRWWVLGDRTQAPSGAGYAVENRVALSRAFPGIFRELNVERLAGFFEGFRDNLAGHVRPGNARVGLLTSRRHERNLFRARLPGALPRLPAGRRAATSSCATTRCMCARSMGCAASTCSGDAWTLRMPIRSSCGPRPASACRACCAPCARDG